MGPFVQGEDGKKLLKALNAWCDECQAGGAAKHSACLNLCLNAQSLQA